MPFLSSQEGTPGKNERQNTCVIVWPQKHKSLHADSSRIRSGEQVWAIRWEIQLLATFWHNRSAV